MYAVITNDKFVLGEAKTMNEIRKSAVNSLKKLPKEKFVYVAKEMPTKYDYLGKVQLNWKGQGVWIIGHKASIIYKNGSIGSPELYYMRG